MAFVRSYNSHRFALFPLITCVTTFFVYVTITTLRQSRIKSRQILLFRLTGGSFVAAQITSSAARVRYFIAVVLKSNDMSGQFTTKRKNFFAFKKNIYHVIFVTTRNDNRKCTVFGSTVNTGDQHTVNALFSNLPPIQPTSSDFDSRYRTKMVSGDFSTFFRHTFTSVARIPITIVRIIYSG